MMCTVSHDVIKVVFPISCPFCSFSFVDDISPKFVCCDKMDVRVDETIRRCVNCNWFVYPYANEYVNYYENRHRIRRKSVYVRKYQFLKIINLFTTDIMRDEKLVLYNFFVFIQDSIGYVKRSMKFSYLIRRMLELKGDCLYECFPLPKSRFTLMKYELITNDAFGELSVMPSFLNFSLRH